MSILNESSAAKISASGGSGSSKSDKNTGAPKDGVSYVKGNTDTQLRHITIPEMFRDTVSRFGSRDALIFAATDRKSVV